MKIKIYQITRKKDKRNLSYTSYVFTQKHGGIDPAEYELVFDGDVGAKNLEDVFCLFNNYATIPAGYRGHCLSVSDVVETENGAFFCDSFGFVRLDGFPYERR